jgi:hypothetical protein
MRKLFDLKSRHAQETAGKVLLSNSDRAVHLDRILAA